MKWAEGRDDCGGVLSPDVKGLRHLYNVRTKEIIAWQRKMPEEGDIIVGRFSFDPEGFISAVSWLNEAMADPSVHYVILDEAGRLELKGKGFDTWLKAVLPFPPDKTLILVVRRSLMDDIIAHYGMDDVSVVEREYFES
jgi:nucleoside-triphosphatase THEP1